MLSAQLRLVSTLLGRPASVFRFCSCCCWFNLVASCCSSIPHPDANLHSRQASVCRNFASDVAYECAVGLPAGYNAAPSVAGLRAGVQVASMWPFQSFSSRFPSRDSESESAAGRPRNPRCPGIGMDSPAKSGFPISRIPPGIPTKSGFKSGKIPISFVAARTVIKKTCQRQARLVRFLVGVPGWEKRLMSNDSEFRDSDCRLH